MLCLSEKVPWRETSTLLRPRLQDTSKSYGFVGHCLTKGITLSGCNNVLGPQTSWCDLGRFHFAGIIYRTRQGHQQQRVYSHSSKSTNIHIYWGGIQTKGNSPASRLGTMIVHPFT